MIGKKLLCVMLVGGVFLVGWLFGRHGPVPTPANSGTTDTGLLIEQIQQLSSLVTTKVDVADVQVTQINGYLGGVRAAILIKGDFLLGVDLSQAKFEQVNPAAKTAVLLLPQPTVTSPRLDQTRTRVFAINDSGLWLLTPGEDDKTAVINRAFEQAQSYVASAADDPGLADRSHQQAEHVLTAFFQAIGWTVTIRWVDGRLARLGPLGVGAGFFLTIKACAHPIWSRTSHGSRVRSAG